MLLVFCFLFLLCPWLPSCHFVTSDSDGGSFWCISIFFSILNLGFFNSPWISTLFFFYLSEFNSDGEEDLPVPVDNGSVNVCFVHCLVLMSTWLDVMIFFNLQGKKRQRNQSLKTKMLQNLILSRRWRLWNRTKMGNPNQRMMIAVMKRMIHLMMASQAMIR